ncbi:MAG: DUF4147 domain-containing protein [Desulfobacterales bacterium]|nr:DUF4147 domain-containing protein [Desulfobacterales bacterium]
MDRCPRGGGGFAGGAEAIWRAAVAAVDPWCLVRESVVREGDVVRIKGREFDLAGRDRVFLISFGKAAAAMGEALAAVLDERLTSGLVVVPGPVGHEGLPARIPRGLPSRPGRAERRSRPAGARDRQRRPASSDLLFVCISGRRVVAPHAPGRGDRARQEAPPGRRPDARRGDHPGAQHRPQAPVRPSRAGGWPGRPFRPKWSPWPSPTSSATTSAPSPRARPTGTRRPSPRPGPSSSGTALWDSASALVRARIEEGERGLVEETLKEGDPVFGRVRSFVVGDNMTALRAAKREAEKRGFEPIFLSSSDGGEARKTAASYAAFLAELACSAPSLPRPLCLLAGGELTVTVTGRGRGGRNTEFVLAALVEMEKGGGPTGSTGSSSAWARTASTARPTPPGPGPTARPPDGRGPSGSTRPPTSPTTIPTAFSSRRGT